MECSIHLFFKCNQNALDFPKISAFPQQEQATNMRGIDAKKYKETISKQQTLIFDSRLTLFGCCCFFFFSFLVFKLNYLHLILYTFI